MQTLTPSTPVTLTYTNDKGLTFKRTFSVDATTCSPSPTR